MPAMQVGRTLASLIWGNLRKDAVIARVIFSSLAFRLIHFLDIVSREEAAPVCRDHSLKPAVVVSRYNFNQLILKECQFVWPGRLIIIQSNC